MSTYGPAPSGHWGDPYGAPVPPPKKSNTPIILSIIGVAVVICVLLTAGFLVVRGLKSEDNGRDDLTASTGDTTSASPSAPPSGDTERIQPAGAPYSYAVPNGYIKVDVPGSDTVGTSAMYETAVAQKTNHERELLAVSVYDLGADTDAYTYAQLQEVIDKLAAQVVDDPGEPERVTVDGKRALRYFFDYDSVKSTNYFIFSGRNEVQVRCQWATPAGEAEIKKGCDELISTMKIS